MDVPYSFAVENGIERAVKSCDFRPEKQLFDLKNLWREPINGLVLLQPSVMNRSFTQDFQPLGNWSSQPGFWVEARRGRGVSNAPGSSDPTADTPQPFSLLMAPVKPAGQRFELIEVLLDQAIAEVQADIANYDAMRWVLQSKFFLAEDESFAIHYHGLSDEMLRKENWFAVQWDNILLHFSHSGRMRIYQTDRNNPAVAPLLLDEVDITTPGEILNRSGYFWFIPMPGMGLAVYHGIVGQRFPVFSTSAQTGGHRGHLIPWFTNEDPDGHPYLFLPSVVNIGMNPYHPTMIGFQNLRFPTNIPAKFCDGAFSLPYPPGGAPSLVTVSTLGDRGAVTGTLMNETGTAPWSAPAYKARMQLALSTADARYTPFVGTYGVKWDPVWQTRATTPVVLASRAQDGVDRLQRLEWSDDADAHFEGRADLLLYSVAASAIAFRGDSTFLLEYSEDGGATWFVFTGGLAKNWTIDVEVAEGWGTYFLCKCDLLDLWERFNETHVLNQTAFDGLTIGQALNNMLTTAGFAAIPDTTLPPDAISQTLLRPTNGEQWRFAPRESEADQDVILMLLIYLRKQNVSYRVRFDWNAVSWVLEVRPRDLDTIWTLLPNSVTSGGALTRDAAILQWDYSRCQIKPEPPEGNVVFAEGLSVTNAEIAQRVSIPSLTNLDSVSNPDSPDFLGRMKMVKVNFHEVSDVGELTKMERRLYDAIAHRRLKADVESQHFAWGLAPNTRIQVMSVEGELLLDTWIKRRTVVVEHNDLESMKLQTDTVWEQEMGKV